MYGLFLPGFFLNISGIRSSDHTSRRQRSAYQDDGTEKPSERKEDIVGFGIQHDDDRTDDDHAVNGTGAHIRAYAVPRALSR